MPYNRKLMASLHGLPCICCGSEYQTVGHHVKSKGSGGSDEPHNLMVLCSYTHALIHLKGLWKVSQDHEMVCKWLNENGWYKSELQNKWCHSLEK